MTFLGKDFLSKIPKAQAKEQNRQMRSHQTKTLLHKKINNH
jgi:hypothetical protein